MTGTFDADVIVIGGGPVGVTALAMLGQRGLTAIGVEKSSDVWPTARAVHFDGEAFRMLQSLGITEKLADTTRPMNSMHIQNEAQEILVSVPTGRFGTQAWPDDLTFHQPDLERVLREAIAELTGIELRCGVTAEGVRNIPGGVEVTTIDRDGAERILRSRWVIASDGARSSVRRSLGIEGDKFGDDADWVVVDGHLKDSPGYEDDMVFICHHTRPAMWVRLPGTRVRMEFMLLDGDDRDEIVTPEAIERISRGVLPAANFTAERQAIYTFRGRIAQRWREGNIFLAGDAAHQAPPCFGQGLCAGIRDIANLVWKLDLVKRGVEDVALLDTYETERKPHARFWVEQAVKAADFLQTLDPEAARRRDAFIRANPAEAAPVSPPLGPGLHDGEANPWAGQLSPQPILADGVRLDELVGLRFALVVDPELYSGADVDLRQQLESGEEVTVIRQTAEVASLLEDLDTRAVLIRPDRHVLGVADSPAEFDRLIRHLPGLAVETVQNA
ncbi:bifunctional 3-(3-hydroxy-phenyl)propionate/3-hydroxycinnamic acid hydroxylase [Corynebacterium hylobatis]|uniref:Bifunctional 3-(3-hydroxy-phenyl)propionate/3-hydroxycinnamic acid hydroxylase n=1 Tax=Corynebacterium hylobatis TaxID=1859290 RepID=A0A3R9ZEL2_9CORY|nr:bifunctional 3-(3-hydroxy-phenyl)propionate/3-hydroxycinnamic acid hydroxylase [Corynebacterium hylobatis]RSZ63861.1 bifunctional 3-(3-hydroxy-phenyl)propionate/3-hydroxycinnamic acid hydroxylase [Corynebacterium hylobatis]